MNEPLDLRELTDQMRTCASYVLSCLPAGGDPDAPCSMISLRVARDAVDLLIEASNRLLSSVHATTPPTADKPADKPADKLADKPAALAQAGDATWLGPHDTLPQPRSPKACPQCDSRTHKKVFRQGRTLMLACPVCAKEWPYG
jgi:hypothetical protein